MAEKQAKRIVVLGRKGGITKSTTAATLAAGCARAGLRTVLVDADGQGNASQYTRVKPHDAFFELIFNDAEFKDVLTPAPLEFHGEGELWVLSSSDGQVEVEAHEDTPTRIYERFNEPELTEWADVVIIDTPPGITHTHTGFYFTADYALMPTLCEYASVQSLTTMMKYLASAAEAGGNDYRAAEIMGILPNRFSGREKVQQVNYGIIVGRYGERFPVFPFVRDLAVWGQASQLRRSIYMLTSDKDYNTRRQANAAVIEFSPVLNRVLEMFAGVKNANA